MRLRAVVAGLAAYMAALGTMWLALGFAVSDRMGPDARLPALTVMIPLFGIAVYQIVLSIGRMRLPVLLVWVAGPLVVYGTAVGMIVLTDAGLLPQGVGIIGLLVVWAALAVAAAHRATLSPLAPDEPE